MNNDRAIVEMAAKAAGIWVGDEDFTDPIGRKFEDSLGLWVHVGQMEDMGQWFNPLHNGNDSQHLMAKHRLVVHVWQEGHQVSAAKTLPGGDDPTNGSDDWYCVEARACGSVEAAIRRVVVLASAGAEP